MYAFDIERPSRLADAVKLLEGAGESQPLAGGQTLIPTLKQRLAMPETLVSLTGIDEIRGLCEDDDGRLCIGAATTHAEVAAGPGRYPGSGALVITSRREIAADDFFQGLFTTALDEGELITEVRFPVPETAAYMKFDQPASRFALTGAFVAKYPDGVRVAITGASNDGVFRWHEAEAARPRGAARSGDRADMIDDLHGTGPYRAHLAKIMTQRATNTAKE